MPDIRTKENLRAPITSLDRAAELAKKIKSGAFQTKEKAETAVDPKESNPADYASRKVESGVNDISQIVAVKSQQIGERSFEQAKIGITNLRQRISEKRRGSQAYHHPPMNTSKNPIRSVQENAKHSIRTSKQAAKAAKKSAKNAEKSAKTAEESVRTSVKVTKAAVKRIHRIIKAIISGIKELIAACVSGGWVALVIILIIGMVALMICSSYGIFFSGEDSGTGMTMRTAVSQINADYYSQIETRKTSNVHDELKMSGDRAAWKEVLAVYAVKLSMDLYEPQEVATMDQHKASLLKCVFWDMHTITSYVTTRSETEIVSYTDEHGRVIPTEQVRTIRTLHIIVSHLSVDTMASRYHFTAEQKETLRDLLSEEFSTMWAAVLRGISSSNLDIVNVAREQIGNIGGQPYWSWYGFPSRVEWCCCFVSWCANECGYIEQGIIPMYSVVDDGANWFKTRGQWLDGSEEPQAGMIIFFDWAYDGLGDGGDHTGIVEKVENGMVYTIEGNSGDACREKSYPIGYYEIMGYGFYEQHESAVSDDAAAQVWAYLKSYGYSDSVAAGIIGNMMRECGGDTLDLKWNIVGHYNGEEYYGLCQWCLSYTPSGFKGSSIKEQCDYLRQTIQSAFANYGGNYGGITYSEFLKSDTRTAAIAFERVYERCGDYANEDARRASNAEKVYNHFH